MKITLIAGARPNFMKIAPIIKAIEKSGKRIEYRLVHTGQHYDKNMSDTFFEELGIPAPDVNLGCGGGTQAEQTAHIMMAFEQELMAHPADIVLVVGDVTSTMACSIVAKKLNTKVCHVEAGIRSWDLTMPEEINRMVTDSLADYMFTTSEVANRNLLRLGAYPRPLPKGRGDKPNPNPSRTGRERDTFANVWGMRTANSVLYTLLKEKAEENRKNPTEAESILWDMLKTNNLGLHFRRQHIILDYIVDFICIEKGLVIELDGGYHNEIEQKIKDERRTAHLQQLGFTELRFVNEELLTNPESVIAKIIDVAYKLPSLNNRDWEKLHLSKDMTSLPLGEGSGLGTFWFVGNVMIDTLLANRSRFRKPEIWDELGLHDREFIVMTMHRPANVDEETHLRAMMEQIIDNVHSLPVIFPIHPRTAKLFYNLWKPRAESQESGVESQEMSGREDDAIRERFPNLHIVEPMGYLEFNYLVERAKAVVTDSGGITEETTVMGVPCITLRDNTERPETCTIGTNELIGTDPAAIKPALDMLFAGQWKKGAIPPLWDGHAAERIVAILAEQQWKD